MSNTNRFEISPHTRSDYPDIVRIGRLVSDRYHLTPEEVEHHDEVVSKTQCFFQRLICRIDGEVVAVAGCNHSAGMFHKQKFWVHVRTAPAFRNQGVGAAMFEEILRVIEPFNPIKLFTQVYEDQPHSIRFAEKLGFEENMRDWESVLIPSDLNFMQFDDPTPRLESEGILIKTLAERQNEPDFEQKLHEMDMAASCDVPSPEPFTPFSFDKYRSFVLQDPSLLPNGFFVASDGDKYVGLSVLWKRSADNALNTGFTGVLREYRRRGIALALKLRAMHFAKDGGYDKVFTQNATSNRPMLSINEMLGFQKLPAEITMAKQLQPELSGENE